MEQGGQRAELVHSIEDFRMGLDCRSGRRLA